jgi:hypothetical protein
MKRLVILSVLGITVLLYSCHSNRTITNPITEIYRIDSFNTNSVVSSGYYLNFSKTGKVITNVFVTKPDTLNFSMSVSKDSMYLSGGKSFTGTMTLYIGYSTNQSVIPQFNSKLKSLDDIGTGIIYRLSDSI